MKTLRSPGYEFGPYRLDTVGRSLECRGEVIALPPKAVEVLAELVKRPGEVVTKKELLETVWPEAFVEEANLNQMVFVLRRAIESTNGSEYITMCRGADIGLEAPCAGWRFHAVLTLLLSFR
jgi:DNA-binding winged helix-turn-helix (wHTH) protein